MIVSDIVQPEYQTASQTPVSVISFDAIFNADDNTAQKCFDKLDDTLSSFMFQNGFVNRTDSSYEFDNETRTFTIQPVSETFVFFSSGIKYHKTTPQQVIIDDSEGLWYIYFNAFGILSASQSFLSEIITHWVFVATIYWDATNKQAILIGEERHGYEMDSQTHIYLHSTFGTQLGYHPLGFSLTNLIVDGNGDNNDTAQLGIAGGIIWDEDIRHIINTAMAPATIPCFFLTGVGAWRRRTASQFPLIWTPGGRANWNRFLNGEWLLAEVTHGNFVLSHIFVCNDPNQPFICVIGQNDYPTITQAREGAKTEFQNLTLNGLPTQEFVLIATLIWETRNNYSNEPKSRLRSTDSNESYIDWRFKTGFSASFSASFISWGQIGGLLTNQVDLSFELSEKQPVNANLTAISQIVETSGFLKKTDQGVWSLDTNDYVTTQDFTNHSHPAPSFASITDKPTTLSGYGITDAYTKTQSDTRYPLRGTYSSDIAALIPGSQSGIVLESIENVHFVIGIKSNDSNDGFYVLKGVDGAIWGVAPNDVGYNKILMQASGVSFKYLDNFRINADGSIFSSSISSTGSISFGSTARQMIDLYNTNYGIGIQTSTQYYRTNGGYAWFRGGVHSVTINDPGTGGTLAMRLDNTSNLVVTGTCTASSFIGNASTATTLATARTIALSGAATGTATSFNGSANITIPVTSLNAANLSGTVPNACISGSYTGMTNLTGSGTVDFSKFYGAGGDTAASPSFSWTEDTDTGIYRSTTDTVGISSAGAIAAAFGPSVLFYKNSYNFPINNVDASSGTQLVSSSVNYFRCKYWTGSASANLDWNIYSTPTSTTPVSLLNFRLGSTSLMQLSSEGILSNRGISVSTPVGIRHQLIR